MAMLCSKPHYEHKDERHQNLNFTWPSVWRMIPGVAIPRPGNAISQPQHRCSSRQMPAWEQRRSRIEELGDGSGITLRTWLRYCWSPRKGSCFARSRIHQIFLPVLFLLTMWTMCKWTVEMSSLHRQRLRADYSHRSMARMLSNRKSSCKCKP